MTLASSSLPGQPDQAAADPRPRPPGASACGPAEDPEKSLREEEEEAEEEAEEEEEAEGEAEGEESLLCSTDGAAFRHLSVWFLLLNKIKS